MSFFCTLIIRPIFTHYSRKFTKSDATPLPLQFSAFSEKVYFYENLKISILSNFDFLFKNRLFEVCAVTDSSVCIFIFDFRGYYFLQFWLPGALYFCNWNEFVGFPRRQRQLFRYSKCSKVEKAFTSCFKVFLIY